MKRSPGQVLSRFDSRRGLAPVELVLALPIWMLLAAAMVIVGNLGAWKIRGHLAVRETAARAIWPRNRDGEANSVEWSRSSAGMRLVPATVPPQLSDPLAAHAVVRGPQLQDSRAAFVLGVNPAAMESVSSALAGQAFLNEPPPLWRRSGVRNRFDREYPVLSGFCGQWVEEADSPSNGLRSAVVWNLPPID